MADEDKKIDDAPEIDKGEEIEIELKSDGDNASDDDGISPDDGIEELKKSLEAQKKAADEERKRRIDAEKRAYEAQVHAQQHEAEAKNAQYHQIVGAISQLEERERGLMAAWTEAKSMGDYQKEAEIQKEMLEAANYLSRLRNGKNNMEVELKRPIQPVAPPVVDPIEAFASTMTPKSGNWLRSHRNFLADESGGVIERNRLLLLAAHNKALAEGLKQDEDDYFDYVEKEIGMRKRSSRREEIEDDEDDSALSSAAAPARRSVSPPAAPVSRGGTRKGTFTLTPAEREAAKFSQVTEEQYYQNKMREQKRSQR
jgi:hypothetical protein